MSKSTNKPKLLIHIGGSKTGSSAIQSFLRKNHRLLASRGVVVPSSTLAQEDIKGHHVWLFQNLLASQPDQAKKDLKEHVENSVRGQKSSTKQIIISAENLSNIKRWPDIFSDIKDEYEISALLYVRRQDDFLSSAWQQWHVKTENDFWAWMLSAVGSAANWQKAIENWNGLIPTDQMTVRVYERDKLHKRDVVADFCQFIDCDTSDCEAVGGGINPSFTEAVVNFLKDSETLAKGPHDNDFYRFVRDLTGNTYIKKKKESILTFEQRMAVLSHYEESNQWVLDKFFDSKEGQTLFTQPNPEDYSVMSDADVEKEKMSLLMDLIYGLYQKPKQGGKPM